MHSGPTLSDFLKQHRIESNQTLFVTMADGNYIDPMLNFKLSLDKWDLGKDYLVLCLDSKCSSVAQSHHILHYDGYYKKDNDTNWKIGVARSKVTSCFPHSRR